MWCRVSSNRFLRRPASRSPACVAAPRNDDRVLASTRRLIGFCFTCFLFFPCSLSRRLAQGNQQIFLEVGGTFTMFGVYFANLTAPDPQRWAAYESAVIAF